MPMVTGIHSKIKCRESVTTYRNRKVHLSYYITDTTNYKHRNLKYEWKMRNDRTLWRG